MAVQSREIFTDCMAQLSGIEDRTSLIFSYSLRVASFLLQTFVPKFIFRYELLVCISLKLNRANDKKVYKLSTPF